MRTDVVVAGTLWMQARLGQTQLTTAASTRQPVPSYAKYAYVFFR